MYVLKTRRFLLAPNVGAFDRTNFCLGSFFMTTSTVEIQVISSFEKEGKTLLVYLYLEFSTSLLEIENHLKCMALMVVVVVMTWLDVAWLGFHWCLAEETVKVIWGNLPKWQRKKQFCANCNCKTVRIQGEATKRSCEEIKIAGVA